VRSWKQRLKLNLIYSLQLFKSSLPMLSFCAFIFISGSVFIYSFYHREETSFSTAMYYMYFLMLAEPTFPITPKHWVIKFLSVLGPLVGIMVVFDLLARFSFHVFSKKTNQKEWVNVAASAYKDHIVICGLGKVGARIFEELSNLGENIVCIEEDDGARGVRAARESGHPVLIDDAKDDNVLLQAGIERAKAVLAVTDNDMVNLEIVLDARKYNSKIRAIARIFEHELGKKISSAFQLDGVYSTSTVAAPFFAAACLDPEIVSSYHVENQRFVVVQTEVKAGGWFDGICVKDAYDKHGIAITTCSSNDEGGKVLKSDTAVSVGQRISFQCSYVNFVKYRKSQKLIN
jgi:voltage-gated potassium channel